MVVELVVVPNVDIIIIIVVIRFIVIIFVTTSKIATTIPTSVATPTTNVSLG